MWALEETLLMEIPTTLLHGQDINIYAIEPILQGQFTRNGQFLYKCEHVTIHPSWNANEWISDMYKCIILN